MSSPNKGKGRKGEALDSKKKQLLRVFQQNLAFLQMFTPEEMDTLEGRLHIFVFARGQILAKEAEYIDYLGIIAEGRAVSKGRTYHIGDTIGHQPLLGYRHSHSETVAGEADGVIIALRLHDLANLQNPHLANKIVASLAQLYAAETLKREDQAKQLTQFETIEDKKISKYLTPEWSTFLNQLDHKEKSKFTTYFPFYTVKQKDLLMTASLKPSLLYVVSGQAVARNKLQQKILQSGHLYNESGFLLNEQTQQNVYCLSSDAIVLIINKELLQNHFKITTFNSMVKIVLNSFDLEYRKEEEKQEKKEESDGDVWSIFKKYPDREILPLPKKNTHSKVAKPVLSKDSLSNPAVAFQTLFKEQMGQTEGKLKTVSSMAESNYDRLISLKTEPKAKESFNEGEVDKLRKEVDILTEKLKFTQEMSRGAKQDLIQHKGRLAMSEVFKQIRKLHQEEDEVIHKANVGEGQHASTQGLLTLKQAFDRQIRENKIGELVAKCAFRWLYLTRKNKASKKP